MNYSPPIYSLPETRREEPSPLAGVLCLFGLFLYIVLSGPLLDAIGFHYSGDHGTIYEKAHPGTFLVFLSFLIILFRHGKPFHESLMLYRRNRSYAALLAFYLIAFLYMTMRDGGAGLAFMIDTHITVPICTLVLACAPARYCRWAIHAFIALAVINCLIGVAESMTHTRIFTYDPTWNVLTEEYFRASALIGHPLANAAFTSFALFISLGLRYPFWLKLMLITIFLIGLVAFGGRSALMISVIGLLVEGLIATVLTFSSGNVTMLRAIATAAFAIAAPAALVGGVYVMVNSPLGERIAAYAYWDKSANSRELAFEAFDYMSDEEKIFGVSNDRIDDIAYRMSLHVDLAYIENPWLLMYMHMGGVLFPFWVIVTVIFIWRLIKGQPLAFKIAVLNFFLIATTFNSIATKNPLYAIMASAVLCAARAAEVSAPKPQDEPVMEFVQDMP